MSHEMYKNDSAMYAAQPAWHGLGTVVEEAPSPVDALKISGLDWEVEKSGSLAAVRQDGGMSYCSDRVATIRKDTNDILGVVSPSYQVIQNEELFDVAYKLGGGVKVETAGSLKNGRQVYVLLKGDTFDATNRGAEVTEYLALMKSFDGTLSYSALPTSVRIVCANTLSMALSTGSRNMFKVKHHGVNIDDKLQAMREALVCYRETGSMFRDVVGKLSMHTWNQQQISGFWLDVYQKLEGPVNPNPKTDQEERDYRKCLTALSKWSTTFDEERSIAGTGPWNAANCVTKWLQHNRTNRGRVATASSKAANVLMGNAQKNSVKVMKMAMDAV